MEFNKIVIGCVTGVFFALAKELYSVKKELWITKNQFNDKIDEFDEQIIKMKQNIDVNNDLLISLEGKINSFSPSKKRKNKIEIEYEEINDSEIS